MEFNLLGTEEAAQLLGYRISYMRQLIHDGSIPSVRIGSARLLRREDVERYIEQRNARRAARAASCKSTTRKSAAASNASAT